jgi:hypothetical protein
MGNMNNLDFGDLLLKGARCLACRDATLGACAKTTMPY